MTRNPPLVVDATPRGPRGPFALERVRGRTVLDHLLDVADAAGTGPVVVRADAAQRGAVLAVLNARAPGRYALADGPPAPDAAALRSDRLYDRRKLARAARRGGTFESAVIWRLDTPGGLEGAGDELVRRQTFQPLGRYWALAPARALARALAPTRVRPNAVTLTASGLFLTAAALVAFGDANLVTNLLAAFGLAAALVLDTADGHLARLQGTASPFGRWLDGWLDEVGDMALHAAAAWSAYGRTGWVGWLLLGMLYGMGKFVFAAGAVEVEPGRDTSAGDGPAADPAGLASLVRLAGHADVRWHLWIVLAAAGRLDAALAAYAVYFPARSVAGALRKAVRHG